jgi:hypothetical protein
MVEDEGCALVLLKVRDGLMTFYGRPSKLFRSADPRLFRKRKGSNGRQRLVEECIS